MFSYKNITTSTRFSIVDLLYELPIPTRFYCVISKKKVYVLTKKFSYKNITTSTRFSIS